jgi:peptidoglycan-associated lipoprotein
VTARLALFAWRLTVAVWVVALAACASPAPAPPIPAPKPASYVVLLDNDDGSIGKVLLTTPAGTTLLERNRQGANLAGPAGQTYDVSQEKIDRDFGAALAAAPNRPFLLYFEIGGAKLTAESERLLPQIFDALTLRTAPDVSVIGHTDTAADDATNEKLGLERAKLVAALIMGRISIEASKVAIDSHGEKNLLIATADNTPEPRNRRVEVTIR